MRVFHMTDIIPLLGLPFPAQSRSSYYIACPCCDKGRDKHLNISLTKDVFRCPRCGFSGGIFDLYAQYKGVKREDVYEILKKRIDSNDVALFKPQKRPAQQRDYIVPQIKEYPPTDVETRDATYRALLGKLSLASDHKENLLSRGLSEDAIIKKGYKTTPIVGAKSLAKQLLAEGFYLAGVPGFFRDTDGAWTFAVSKRGILIPMRDLQGRIQGLQIRLDNTIKRKFRWVSSSERQDGCKAGGWVHIAGPVRETVILIEGPLKADVIYHLTGQTVIAVPGVNTLTQLEIALTELRTEGVRKIMTAFDMDFMRKHSVQSGYIDLTALLDRMGFSYGTYLWHPDYNGLDDYIWDYLMHDHRQ